MFRLGKNSLNNMVGVRSEMVEICHEAIRISTIDFGIPKGGGKRTAEYQNDLYMDGKSKCDGYVSKSKHQSGDALDFYAYVDGKASWEKEHLAIIGAAFLQAAINLGYRIKWGGVWKGFCDMPHVELVE